MEKIHFPRYFALESPRVRPCPRESVYCWSWIFLKGNSTFRPRNHWICFFKNALQNGVGRPVHTIVPCKRIQHNLGFWIPLRGLIRIPGTGFWSLLEELGVRIPIVSGIPDSLSWIPDSKAQDFRFHQKNFSKVLDSRIQNPLHGANTNPGNNLKYAVSETHRFVHSRPQSLSA